MTGISTRKLKEAGSQIRFWFKYIILTPNQLTAGALVIQYWVPREQINPGVFIAIFWVTIVVINLFGVRFFGEFEFWLSSFKVIVIVGLLILSLVLAVGGGPDHQVHGFRYWEDPGAFAEYIDTGAKGRFLAFWSVMIFATYAYLGTELVGVTAGEAQNPRRTIPRAIKLTFYRILVFYCLGVLLLGMLLPYNSPELAFASTSKSGSASASPFVVAIKLAGIQALPGILNACILVFVFSQANSDLYIGSRTLYGLAREGKAPAIFGRTNAAGVPVYALAATAAVALLAFMNVADDSTRVFGYFVNMNTIFGLLTWISILVTHVGFVRARRAQNVPDTALAYVAPLGVRGSYAALACCIVIALTKNFTVFIRHRNSDGSVEAFDYRGFITGYIGIPLYLLFIFGYKFWTKSPGVNPHQADLWTGKDVIDREEEEFLAQQAAREMERVKAGKKALADNWWYRTFVAPLF